MKRPTLCWLSTRYALTVLAVGLASCTAPEPAPDSLDAAPAAGLVTPVRSATPTASRIAPRFETLQMADGLVSSEANVFLQDRQGFLWIGTFNGLSRYDGASFQNYLHDPADSTSLGHNAINWLHQDRAGAIWIGTNGGLGRFDPVTATFQHLRHDPEDPASLGHNIVRGLAEGRDGAIWAGTRGGGLNRLDPATGTFTRVPRPAAQLGLERTSANTVHAVLANPDGTLWVGGTDGLARYDPSNSRFDVVHRDPSDSTSALLPAVSCLVRDHTGALWAGTTFNGVYRFDPATRSLTHYAPDASDPHALGEAWVLSLAVGGDGTVWLGTNGAGLHRYDPQRDRFDRFVYDPSNPQSLRDNNVLALIETRDGVLWAGTYAGLARRYPLSVHVARERVRPDALGGLETNDVNGFAEASDGTLWIATDGAGLQRRDPSGQVTRVQHERKRTDARMATDVLSVAMDERDGLWVGAVGNLYYRDPARDQFSVISYPGSSLVSPVVYDMHATEGRLLAASGSIGVLDIDLATRQVDRLPLAESGSGMAVLPGEAGQVWAGGFVSGLWEAEQQPDGSRVLVRSRLAISAGFIRTLYEDRSGAVWIGTSDGLDRLTVENGQQSLTSFRREDGLPNTSIIDVLEDDRGRLWIATSAGLSWRDPSTGRFVSYDAGDGMETGGPVYRSPHSGRFYLGGKAGFSEFDPDAIEAEPPPPAPVLTGLLVQGESVRIGSEPLRIQHADRVVTFAFASLDFRAPQTHRYAVRLDGFDEDWRAVGQQRQATFTNLNPGHYTFRVRAAGRDGTWGTETRLGVTVVPPWWRTWWAYAGYVLLAVGLLSGGYQARQRRIALRHRLELERMEAENLRELDQARSRFFANVSHEFRTPLTLTLGPLDDLTAGLYGPVPAPMAGQLTLARRNAARVLDLINQILDVARLEAGRTPLRARPLDLSAFVWAVAQPFQELAARKAITFGIEEPAEPAEVYADPEQLEKAIANVLSNAVKFTPSAGTVRVMIAVESRSASVAIRDSGPGIPAADLPHVFDRFYQVNQAAQTKLGTGIGLALAKEVVDLHAGTLTVESEEGFGSTFTITLPLGHAHLRPDQLDDQDRPWEPAASALVQPASPVSSGDGHVQEIEAEAPDVTTVLVVDDHPEVRAYVRRHLAHGKPAYRVIEAADGEEGVAVARQRLPDLVVSDVMMPQLDGFGLCRALKSDPETDFIPVVLLTAKAEQSDRLEGLSEQADDYLTKPFDPAELRARIHNLIAIRQRLRERFQHDVPAGSSGTAASGSSSTPAKTAWTSADEAFLTQVREAVATHLSDEAFSVERLAAAVGVSRGHLHRQLKTLDGQSPSDLIRTMRLERAAELLQANAGTVSEIGYAVGFKSVAHFSNAFDRHFGRRPSAW